MAFVEKLYIFVGEKNCFFTLRHSQIRYYVESVVHGVQNIKSEVVYYHMCNLSQDYAEALEKAKSYAEKFGMPLVAADTVDKQLNEIKRRNAEEIAEANRIAEEIASAKEAERFEREKENFDIFCAGAIASIMNGIFPTDNGSQYADVRLEEIPVSYLRWILSLKDSEVPFSRFAFIAKTLEQFVGIPEAKVSEYVGNEKDKVELEIQVQRTIKIDGAYGTTAMYIMEDIHGNEIVWFSSNWALEGINNFVKIKATVKSQKEYNGKKQTIITRAKVL